MRTRAWRGVVIVAALLLAACGGDDTDGASRASSSPTTTSDGDQSTSTTSTGGEVKSTDTTESPTQSTTGSTGSTDTTEGERGPDVAVSELNCTWFLGRQEGTYEMVLWVQVLDLGTEAVERVRLDVSAVPHFNEPADHISEVAPSDEEHETVVFSVPSEYGGQPYQVVGQVDPSDDLAETNEQNNRIEVRGSIPKEIEPGDELQC